jgi:hypothetical protein
MYELRTNYAASCQDAQLVNWVGPGWLTISFRFAFFSFDPLGILAGRKAE